MTSWPICSSYSSNRASRSASRIFWIITCLAVWAPMRPIISSGSSGSPLCVPSIAPFSRSIRTTMFVFFAVVLLGGRDQGRFDALEDDFLVDVLVAVDRVDDAQQFIWIHGDLVFCLGFAARPGPSPGLPSPGRVALHVLTRSSIKQLARDGSNPTATSCPTSDRLPGWHQPPPTPCVAASPSVHRHPAAESASRPVVP